MYFWNSQALARQLKTGSLSQRERVKYLVATLLVVTIATYVRSWSSYRIAVSETLVAMVATVLGVWICFSANEQGDGKDFTDRFICLGWTTSIRVGLAFVATRWLCTHLVPLAFGDAFHIRDEYRGIFNLGEGLLI